MPLFLKHVYIRILIVKFVFLVFIASVINTFRHNEISSLLSFFFRFADSLLSAISAVFKTKSITAEQSHKAGNNPNWF